MAEFCHQCSVELGFRLPSDGEYLARSQGVTSGLVLAFLCEGCGPTRIDHEGRCIFHAGLTSRECCEAGLRAVKGAWAE